MKLLRTLKQLIRSAKDFPQFRKVSFKEQKGFFKFSINAHTFMMALRTSLIRK